MTSFLIFAFTVRGMILGALFWFVEIFLIQGPRGKKIRDLPYGPKLTIKVVFYVIAVEVGLFIGQLIFNPENPWGFL